MKTIYIDLDETLIHSIYGRPGMGNGRTVVHCGTKENGRPETYHTLLRPQAINLLLHCRAITTTVLLTAATKAYAVAQNEAFLLGFHPEHILAREDYLEEVGTPAGTEYILKKRGTDPNSWLIDNLAPSHPISQEKIKFLGIPTERYIQIREFNGKDPEKFDQELTKILNTLRGIKPKRAPTTPNLEGICC